MAMIPRQSHRGLNDIDFRRTTLIVSPLPLRVSPRLAGLGFCQHARLVYCVSSRVLRFLWLYSCFLLITTFRLQQNIHSVKAFLLLPNFQRLHVKALAPPPSSSESRPLDNISSRQVFVTHNGQSLGDVERKIHDKVRSQRAKQSTSQLTSFR